MYAQITMAGRVTQDVELRTNPRTSTPYLRASLAVNEGYGEHTHTSFYQCWFEGEEATRASKAGVRKGSLLFVSGAVSIVDTQRKDGTPVTIAKVSRCRWDYIPTGKKAEPEPAAAAAPADARPQTAAPAARLEDFPCASIDDDGDVPF